MGRIREFTVGDTDFLVDGRPVRLLSGALHYFRVHEAQWGHRLAMPRAMGLNCVETYVPWTLHEAGLWAIARPGPYICAEWENGGSARTRAWRSRRWAGANQGGGALHDGPLQPDVTSYDNDATVDEYGRPTEQFWAFRDVLADYARAAVLRGTGRRPGPGALRGEPVGGYARVEFWVESLGRVDYGPGLGESKGITGGVLHERQYLHDVRARGLRLDALDDVAGIPLRELPAGGAAAGTPDGLYRGTVTVRGAGDARLELPGWTRGFAWINATLSAATGPCPRARSTRCSSPVPCCARARTRCGCWSWRRRPGPSPARWVPWSCGPSDARSVRWPSTVRPPRGLCRSRRC